MTRLSSLVTDWEPCLSVTKPPRHAVLYEPDGTLYAIALNDCALEIPRRGESLESGDIVVIPRGFPVDAGSSADFLGICHDGPPPDHFRERFIQVRGFDVPSAEPETTEAGGFRWRIPRTEVRYRVAYATLDVTEANGGVSLPLCPFLRLAIAIKGEAFFRSPTFEPAPLVRFPARSVVLTYPGQPLAVEGNVRLGILEILTDLEHQERRRLSIRGASEMPSPEFRANPIVG